MSGDVSDEQLRLHLPPGIFAKNSDRKYLSEISSTMVGFKLFDYAICLFGIFGALHNMEIFGRAIGGFRIIIFFISTTVLVYAGTGIFLARFTGHGTEADRRAYLFHLITNSLPIITDLVL